MTGASRQSTVCCRRLGTGRDWGLYGGSGGIAPPEPLFFDELASELEANGVVYALVGGVAVNLPGVPRMTSDIDLVSVTDVRNLVACERAMGALGLAPRWPLKRSSLADEAVRRTLEEEKNLLAFTFTVPTNPLREVDLLIAPTLDPVASRPAAR